MEEISIKLFTGAYNMKPELERRTVLLAVVAIALQLALALYLTFSDTFSPAIVVLFLINMTTAAYFLFITWLDGNPKYRRHLTFTEEGVRYRIRFMQPEHAFEWEEIDQVQLELLKVIFILKNEEEHVVSLEQIQNDEVLWQVMEKIRIIVNRKSVILA